MTYIERAEQSMRAAVKTPVAAEATLYMLRALVLAVLAVAVADRGKDRD